MTTANNRRLQTVQLGTPSAKQDMFLRSHRKYIGYGGARGGGKSWAVRVKAILLAQRFPGIHMLIVRRTYKELEGNHIRTLRAMTRDFAAYNSTEKLLTFSNGSTIEFMYCARDADLDKLQGLEYDVIFLDEATQLSEYQMRTITATLRGVNDFPKRVYYTCNPGGQGHQYIKRLFIDKQYKPGENPEDYEFIQALVDDNTALMESQPDYLKQLEALPKALREAWRYGRWDVFAGQVFTEFTDAPEHYADKRYTHVIEPFPIPIGWNIYRGFDWGYSKPFSVGWYAVAPSGRMYRFAELYGCTGEPNEGVQWTVDHVAEEIRRMEEEHPYMKGRHVFGIADPAIFAEDGGESIAETMEKHRVYFDRGDHQRIPGKMQCHYRLAFDDDGRPMFYVFNTCKHFIRCIPALMYDETRVEDIDTSLEDHNYDEWRYVCMARPIAPREMHHKKIIDPNNIDDPLNMVRDKVEGQQADDILTFYEV